MHAGRTHRVFLLNVSSSRSRIAKFNSDFLPVARYPREYVHFTMNISRFVHLYFIALLLAASGNYILQSISDIIR